MASLRHSGVVQLPITNIPLPSFDALVAFESAARHECFTRAAAELNVTQGAISRQIRVLEDRLGVLLFQRVRRRVVLAEAGRAYLHDVRRVLNHLESATVRVMTAADRANVLNLAVLPSIATHWLIPRLPDFLSKHPDVSVSCTTRQAPFDFATEPFDAAFHLGSPTWAGTVAHHLMSECLVPVCTPAFRSAHGIDRVDDLMRMPLTVDNVAMLSTAAIAGLGVALLPTFFVEAELREGKLVALARPQPTRHAYYLVVPEAKAASPHIKAFVRWIKEAKQARLTAAPARRVSEREQMRRVAS